MKETIDGSQIAKLQLVESELKRIAHVLETDHDPNVLYAEAAVLNNLAEDLQFYLLRYVEPKG